MKRKKPILPVLKFGDIVRLKFQTSGKRKLADVWTSDKYTVTRVNKEVITISNNLNGTTKVVNRSKLKKIGEDITDEELSDHPIDE